MKIEINKEELIHAVNVSLMNMQCVPDYIKPDTISIGVNGNVERWSFEYNIPKESKIFCEIEAWEVDFDEMYHEGVQDTTLEMLKRMSKKELKKWLIDQHNEDFISDELPELINDFLDKYPQFSIKE